jgi:hypothetical protein
MRRRTQRAVGNELNKLLKNREQKTLIETLRLLDLSQQYPLTILKFYA